MSQRVHMWGVEFRKSLLIKPISQSLVTDQCEEQALKHLRGKEDLNRTVAFANSIFMSLMCVYAGKTGCIVGTSEERV